MLDLTHGRPAAGMDVRLLAGDQVLFTRTTNADGRLDEGAIDIAAGAYRLEFEVGTYFRSTIPSTGPAFLETVVIAFQVTEAEGAYHVPLLVSPFGYSTYRGS